MASLGTLVTTFTANTGSLMAGIGKAAAAVAAFSAAVGAVSFATWGVSLAAAAEQMEMQFDVLTGKGKKVFADIESFAVRTSFSLESAGEAARNMLASGVSQPELIGTMRILGDLAMGDGERMKLLSKAYTDVMNKQKLQAQELRQFSENGVGLVSELARMYGKTAGEILAMSEAGKIGFTDMRRALERLTGEGGRFNGMMEKMSQTTAGRFDTLKENIAILTRTVADQFLPAINDVLKKVNDFLEVITASSDRWQTMKDVFIASWELLLATAKFKWDEWASDIGSVLFDSLKEGLSALDPTKLAFELGGAFNGQAFIEMEHAQLKFNHLMEQLKRDQANAPALGGAVPGMPTDLKGTQAALTQFAQLNKAQRIAMFGGQQEAVDRQQALREQLKKLKQQEAMSGLGGMFQNLLGHGQMAAEAGEGWLGQQQIKGNFWWQTLQSAFNGDWMRGKDRGRSGGRSWEAPERLAAALQKGSQDAYTAIVRSAGGGSIFEQSLDAQTEALLQPLNKLANKDALPVELVGAIV